MHKNALVITSRYVSKVHVWSLQCKTIKTKIYFLKSKTNAKEKNSVKCSQYKYLFIITFNLFNLLNLLKLSNVMVNFFVAFFADA